MSHRHFCDVAGHEWQCGGTASRPLAGDTEPSICMCQSCQVSMENGDHSGCAIELLACPEHMDEQLRQMGYEPGTSNMPRREEETEPSIFTDNDGERSVGFCLWCNRDFHSTEEVAFHNDNDMAECPAFQEYKAKHRTPPVLQVVPEDAESPGEHAEVDSEEGNCCGPTKKLELGQIVATPGALAAMEESGDEAGTFLARHSAGDWGKPLRGRPEGKRIFAGEWIQAPFVVHLKHRHCDLGHHRSRPLQHDYSPARRILSLWLSEAVTHHGGLCESRCTPESAP